MKNFAFKYNNPTPEELVKSLKGGYTAGQIFIIIGLISFIISSIFFFLNMEQVNSLILLPGTIMLAIGNLFIAIQRMRENKIAYGLLMVFFGIFTLDIWPLIDSFIAKSNNKVEKIVKSFEKSEQFSEVYVNTVLNTGRIISLISLLLFIVGLISFLILGNLGIVILLGLLFFSLLIAEVGGWFITTQLIKTDNLKLGIFNYLFTSITFGIVGLIVASYQMKKNKKTLAK